MLTNDSNEKAIGLKKENKHIDTNVITTENKVGLGVSKKVNGIDLGVGVSMDYFDFELDPYVSIMKEWNF